MKKKIHISISVTVLVMALLTGCGGGGGGGSGNAPALSATAFSTNEDTEMSGQIGATDVDGDAVTFSKTSDPSKGTVASFTNTGAFVYRPNADANGSDTFGVRATDARGNSTDGMVTITVSPVNDAPSAVNDVMRKDTQAELGSLDVRANDAEADGETTTVIIEEQPTVGIASVNADGTIGLTGLPAGFKGVSRFKYRITDPNNTFGIAAAAIFVGTDPFRVSFAGDEAANGSPEVFMTDFVGASWRVSNATEGNLRLAGFVASDNGSTVVYRRNDITAPGTSDLSFVRTVNTGNQVRITLPTGFSLIADSPGAAQYAVSPNGQWIAVLAANSSAGNPITLFVLNVDDPGNLRPAMPASAMFASTVRFSSDSSNVYFLASDQAGGESRKVLYKATLSATPSVVQLSASPDSGPDVSNYSVASDQSRIVLLRGSLPLASGIFYVDPNAPGAEVQLSSPGIIVSSTVGLPEGLGGSAGLTHVAYSLSELFGANTYIADVNSTPNARLLVSSASVIGFRPNDASVLFGRVGPEIWEKLVDSPTAEERVAAGSAAVFDSAGDTVILTQNAPSNTVVLAAAYRGAFGTAQKLGTANEPARFIGLSGASRAVALLGEGTTTNANLKLVNARAPDRPIPLANFQTPLNLTSPLAYVVTY